MRGESYYERTVSNVVKERYLPSVRGKILDRKGVALADNRPAFNIYATPKQLDAARPRPSSSACSACPTTRSRRSTSGSRSARSAIRRAPILVLEDQGRDRAALVEQARARLPGVEVHHEPYRYYPQGDLAAHLDRLHDADDRGRGRQARPTQGYDPSELVGRYGLESRVGELPARQEGRRALRGRRARPAARRQDRRDADRTASA